MSSWASCAVVRRQARLESLQKRQVDLRGRAARAAPRNMVGVKKKASGPMSPVDSRPSRFFSITQQCSVLAFHYHTPQGAGLFEIVEAAEATLNIDPAGAPLVERAAACYDALYKQPASAHRALHKSYHRARPPPNLIIADDAPRFMLCERGRSQKTVRLTCKSPPDTYGQGAHEIAARMWSDAPGSNVWSDGSDLSLQHTRVGALDLALRMC